MSGARTLKTTLNFLSKGSRPFFPCLFPAMAGYFRDFSSGPPSLEPLGETGKKGDLDSRI